ncbi:MAG: hypothetical protein LBN23_05330 [Paludibacter sp.]|jgi:hypothetical protein|nr:hypothetical protein [Paludibacter sp.]
MKKMTLIILGFCLTISSFGQTTDNQKIIELAKAYKDFMFINELTKDVLKDIKKDVPENLTGATEFIIQTITTKNKLLTQLFLTLPDEQTLKQIYVIRAVNANLREENPIDNNKLVDSLIIKPILKYELVNNYYKMLFTAVGNKNKPFNLSKIDFKMKEYNLQDDTEKGILFFQCMTLCGTNIWGYMNIVKPQNTAKAYEYIKRYPKFNGQPYYQYSDFYFADFEMNIVKDKGIESYKSYYLNKYYETLLYHLICLNKEGGSEKEKNKLLLGSILKDKTLYKYTKYKDTLEKIFEERTRE